MSYCVYLRKSRKDIEAETRGEGETLARHQNILLDLAKRQNLTITNIYREIVSGETISSRPIMQHLLSEVEQKRWDGVLVVEVERLARGDTVDQGIVAQAFKYSNTKIITPTKTYDPTNIFDEEYFEFGLFMSRREYKTITRRLNNGRIQSVKEGKYVGSKPPYGYDRIKLPKAKGFTLKPNENADTVKIIFNMAVNKIGAGNIANELNKLGLKSQTGQSWSYIKVRSIISNPVYYGKIVWGRRKSVKTAAGGHINISRPFSNEYLLVDGLHEAIVDNDTWQKAQKAIHSSNAPRKHKNSSLKNPFAGLIYCKSCGRAISRKPFKKAQDALYCTDSMCETGSATLSSVEQHILEAIKQWLTEYKINYKNSKENKPADETTVIKSSIKNIEKKKKTTETQLSNLHNLLEQGVYSIETFLKRSKTLNDELKEQENQLNKLHEQLNQIAKKTEACVNVIPKFENFFQSYSKAQDAEIKNNLLKSVLARVEYYKPKNNKNGKFDIIIYPRLDI